METSQIINELRNRFIAFDATGNHKIAQLFKEAADLIEELQEKPWVESVQVDKLDQRIDALQGAIEQIRWERDMAMQQLAEHGIPFGGKADDVFKVCRCKDCKWYKPSVILSPNRFCYRLLDNDGNHIGYNMADEDFCSHAERKSDGKEEG